jgi:hypothetical protein
VVARHSLRAALFCSVSLLVASALAQDASFTASVDRGTIRENESFTYVLRAEGRVSGEPDVSAIELDFDILNRSTSARIQSINGRTQQVAEYIYQLMPRSAGEFTLPSIEVGGIISNTVSLEVLPVVVAEDAPADIFMEVELEPASAYVQSQVVYTLRLFVGVGIGRATLTQPLISGGEAILERLGEDSQFRTVRGTRSFDVRERRYAIFPQASGTLTIGPSTFEAMVIPNRGFSRVQRLRSDTVTVDVKPAVAPPASHPRAVWLPARHLQLSERWADQSTSFSLGVPRTRVLSIVADGLLETQLPELEIGQAEGIRQYPDQPELSRQITETGLQATRTERYAVIAQAAGEALIPAAEIPWWNVVDERWEIARIEAEQMPVFPGNDASPLSMGPQLREPVLPAPQAGFEFWPLLAAVMAIGWLLTGLGWWRTRSGALFAAVEHKVPKARSPSSRTILKQLRAACAVDDAARVQQLLLQWGKLQFSDAPPASLGALADSLRGELAEEVARLEGHLYGQSKEPWRGAALSKLLANVNAVTRGADRAADDPLVPLYR